MTVYTMPNRWQVVVVGDQRIAVSTIDGLALLPKALRPEDWADFAAAAEQAVALGATIRAANNRTDAPLPVKLRPPLSLLEAGMPLTPPVT